MKKLTFFLVLMMMFTLLVLTLPVSAGARTLEVGPGKPYTTIQKAVDDAEQGAKILVYADYYVENVLVTTNNLQIIAQGDGVVVYSPDEDVADFTVYADHVVIRGFTLLGTYFVPGIEFNGSYNTFAENTIDNAGGPGNRAFICIDNDGGSNYNRIEDNNIVHGDFDMVIAAKDPGALNVGNIIQNNTFGGAGANSLNIQNGSHFTISGNTFHGTFEGDCIVVNAENDVAQGHHRITDNTLMGCAGNGAIGLYAWYGATSSHNHVTSNEISYSEGSSGIILFQEAETNSTMSDNLVKDNTVSYSSGNGIWLYGGVNKNKILNNIVMHSGIDGIAIEANDNHIIGNTVTDSGVWDLADWGLGNKWRNNTYDTASWE